MVGGPVCCGVSSFAAAHPKPCHTGVARRKVMKHGKVRIDRQGRIAIPAELRRSLDLRPGEELVARARDGQLVLEKREAIERRLLSWLSSIPPEVSLVDELIADRREAARRECEEMSDWSPSDDP